MTLTQCTPIIPVADLQHAGAWFSDCPGFHADHMGGTGVRLSRDAAVIHLVQAGDDMDMDDPRRQQSVYISLEDVDAFYAGHKSALDTGGTRVRAPFDRDYGMRELHVIYESLLMFFGAPISKDSKL